MEQCPVPFPVWDMPWQDEEPCDVPHLDQQRQLVAVSVYHGQPFGKGSGAMVTSYNPQVIFVDGQAPPEGNHFEVVMRGPLALGRATALRFAEAFAQTENRTPVEIADQLEPFVRYTLQDAFIQCGNCLVPAVEFGFGIPRATVIVSADLLMHPIALGFWGWQVKTPVLKRAEFDWE